jgi:uncharacterized protein YndB with AHSA1/START domain
MSELRLSRRYAAAPERVFDAWTDPAVLRRWWAAHPDWDSPAAEADARPGGRYRLSMTDTSSGETRTVAGEYTVVERPRRLVYTWRWEGMPTETVVTVEFHGEGDGTRVELHQAGFPDAHDRDMHADGWNGCLDNLARRVFPGG